MKKRKPSRRRSPAGKRSANRKHSRPAGNAGSRSQREWVGGRLLAPIFIGPDDPHRPVLELWVANDYIVHAELYDPNEPMPPVSDDVRRNLLDPPVGRRPRRLRLNDPDWAAQVRRALPMFEVVVGPTPELEGPLEALTSTMENERPPSYLENRLPADAMAALFAAASSLYRLEPWKRLDDDQLIEVNIPALDVQGACLSIIGALGESYGLLLFASLQDYERMLEMADELEETGRISGLGCVITSLSYERGADLPASLRREVDRCGWPVAGAAAYPVVEHRGEDGLARSLTPRELHIITACTEALVSVLEQHRDASAAGELPIFSLSHVDREGLEVRLKSPPASSMTGADGEQPSATEVLEDTLLVRLFEYANARWGRRFINRVSRLICDEAEAQLMFRVGAFHLAMEDAKTPADWFIEERAATLSDSERRHVAAQQAAWLSLWEVTRVVPGQGLDLRDLLTGDARRVAYRAVSETVPERGVLLARIVRCDTGDLVTAHPAILSPLAARHVAERMRKYLRCQSAIAPERLRHPNSVRYLLKSWQHEIAAIDAAEAPVPELTNTDGEPFVGTIDRYAYEAADRPRVESALLGLRGFEADRPGHYVFLRENIVIASIELEEQALRVETNSVERADLLRQMIEGACAGLIRHRGRTHEGALAALEPQQPARKADDIPPEQLELLVQAHKRQHYENWLDEPIPALGNQTPRAAVRSRSGRLRVAALISELEYREASLPAGQRFDVSVLRRALKL